MMESKELSQEELRVAGQMLSEVSAILAAADGAEIRAARNLVEHVALRLSQMKEGDFALQIA
jgi:hypothetical protein